MHIDIYDDPEQACVHAAAFIGECARTAIAARTRFVCALSGGRTPTPMFAALACIEGIDWNRCDVLQVDERVAPAGDSARNLTSLSAGFAEVPDLVRRVHPMPVEAADPAAGAAEYAATLHALAGVPATLDVVHLGLGTDGHTASLVPGDPVLDVTDVDVAITRPYAGHRRMTLTFPVLDRARALVWLVVGADKASALRRICDADSRIPAGRVSGTRAHVFADRTAAGSLGMPRA